jgi:SAM-dependent methyltransferase
MKPVDDAILRHYEGGREEDRISGGFAQLELVRTQEVLRRHLPAPPAKIVDIGGATGIHAAWLAQDGYQVRVVDIAPRHVAKTNTDLGPMGVIAEIGDARALSASDATFDAALLLGPLYHLSDRAERLGALGEASRVVRPGGVIAVAAVSRFASLFDGLARQFIFEADFAAMARQDLRTGQHRNPEERPHWWTTAFLHHPDELRGEMEEVGLKVIELVGLEGLAGYLPRAADRWANPLERETILWAARAVESEPSLLGLSAHLLAVAATPS